MSEQNSVRPLSKYFVSSLDIKDRVDRFKNHPNRRTLAGGGEDTRNIWYSLDHIKDIYEELLHQKADGLRIYFGLYPENHNSYPGQTCLLMVPTKAGDDDDERHVDIIFEELPDFEVRSQSTKAINISGQPHTNYGTPCPPRCGGGLNDAKF